MTDHSSQPSPWALSVAADSLKQQPHGADACCAAAFDIANHDATPFAVALARLYLATNDAGMRFRIVALSPSLFANRARMLGHEFNLVAAGLASPAPCGGNVLHQFKHENLGWLECHLSVEAPEAGGPDCPPDAGAVEVEAVYMGAIDMTERMSDYELTLIRDDFCAEKGFPGSRAKRRSFTQTTQYPQCTAVAAGGAHAS